MRGGGKRQLERVAVYDGRAQRIRTRNWVAANLWSTEDHGKRPISLLWDPPGEGRDLSDEEKSDHAKAIRIRRVRNIAGALGRTEGLVGGAELPGLKVRVHTEPSEPEVPEPLSSDEVLPEIELPPEGSLETQLEGESGQWHDSERTSDESEIKHIESSGVARRVPSREIPDSVPVKVLPASEEYSADPHENSYAVAIVSRFGIAPILDRDDLATARELQKRAQEGDEAVMLFGLAADVLTKSGEAEPATWLSGGGIVSRDGVGLFDLKAVEFGED